MTYPECIRACKSTQNGLKKSARTVIGKGLKRFEDGLISMNKLKTRFKYVFGAKVAPQP